MYGITGKEITVLNELVEIGQEYLQYFSDAVFSRYPRISVINCNCLTGRPPDLSYPRRVWRLSHDIAIPLPSTFEAYHVRLGKQTQKHIRYYLNRLQREFHDFAFHVATAHEIDPAVIGRIVEMNRLRMKNKNVRSGFSTVFEKRIIEFCKYYGVVSTVSIKGRIVAGAVSYAVGNQSYLEVIAHDPEYNKYNAGQVCLYLTVKHMVESGGASFHLLWGENEYKYRFLGVKEDLYFMSIYRSYSSKLSSAPKLMKHICISSFRQLEYLTKKYIVGPFRQRKCR
jgi:CelD/BcsL family acetyltransferase involved in cellulose biosynthesis